MPKASVSDRLRRKLRALLKHGDAAALAKFSQERPSGQRLYAQELSYFLNNQSGRRGVTLDDLDDIADYFRLTIGELFDVPARDLSGDELRLLFAFRALPPANQEHLLAVIETMAVTAQPVTFRRPAAEPDQLRQTLLRWFDRFVHGLPANGAALRKWAEAAPRLPELDETQAALSADTVLGFAVRPPATRKSPRPSVQQAR